MLLTFQKGKMLFEELLKTLFDLDIMLACTKAMTEK